MLRSIAKLVRLVLVAAAVVMVVFVVGMRTKSPRVRRTVRTISRATRRFTMDAAGKPGAYASIVRHVGRTTGRTYDTPVRVAPTDDGFVITLPYGPRTDWVKNVLRSGTATVVTEGDTVEVDDPEIVSAAVAAHFFPAKDQRTQRLFGVDEYLRVRSAIRLVR